MLLFIKQPTLYFKETKAQTFMWCYFANNTMKPQVLNITDNLMVALEWSNKPSSRTAPSYRLKSNKRIINHGRTDLKVQVFKLLTGLHFSPRPNKNLYLCLYLSDTTSSMTSFPQSFICQIKKYVFGNSTQLIIMFGSKDASD